MCATATEWMKPNKWPCSLTPICQNEPQSTKSTVLNWVMVVMRFNKIKINQFMIPLYNHPAYTIPIPKFWGI
jgi:hypothetical protein